jgi:hypothetical protein
MGGNNMTNTEIGSKDFEQQYRILFVYFFPVMLFGVAIFVAVLGAIGMNSGINSRDTLEFSMGTTLFIMGTIAGLAGFIISFFARFNLLEKQIKNLKACVPPINSDTKEMETK